MFAVYTKMHSPHLPLKIPALTDGPVLIPPARAGVCWSCPIVFGVHLQTSLPLALPAVHLHGAADLFRDVCGDVVVIVSPWTRASPSPPKLSHSSTAFPFPSDLPRSQERQRVLEQHHGVSQGLRGVSRRGKLVCLWSFDSTVCCCIGATMKTINKRDMQ